jgi:hypothetical protein
MDGFGLTREEYMELYWLCRQYPDKKQRLALMLGSGGVKLDGMPHGTDPGNPTLAAVMRREPLMRDCEIIEQAAIEAWPEGYKDILRNVALGESFERICPSCGKNQFTQYRRKFFYILWLKRVETAG